MYHCADLPFLPVRLKACGNIDSASMLSAHWHSAQVAASVLRLLSCLQVAAQYASTAIISPPVDPNDENAQRTKNIVAFLPLMIGYFALQVPSGLSLYYFSNTVLTSAQQIWLRKLGGTNYENHTLMKLHVVSIS